MSTVEIIIFILVFVAVLPFSLELRSRVFDRYERYKDPYWGYKFLFDLFKKRKPMIPISDSEKALLIKFLFLTNIFETFLFLF